MIRASGLSPREVSGRLCNDRGPFVPLGVALNITNWGLQVSVMIERDVLRRPASLIFHQFWMDETLSWFSPFCLSTALLHFARTRAFFRVHNEGSFPWHPECRLPEFLDFSHFSGRHYCSSRDRNVWTFFGPTHSMGRELRVIAALLGSVWI